MMTISLPEDLENSLRVEVQSGRFSSLDDAITEAVRLLLGRGEQGRTGPATEPVAGAADGAQTRQPIWEVIEEITASVPEEEWDKLPTDASEQLDHYIYGTRRRPTA